MLKKCLVTYLIIAQSFFFSAASYADHIPYLNTQGRAVQIIVDGSPFLIRGGELGNSTASNLEYLGKFWNRFQSLNLNTLIAPVYWDLIEPEEGIFDFSLVDGLIKEARKQELKLVLLWFGSWKNSMSSYSPHWVKVNFKKYPRSRDRDGQAFEILSPFYEENYNADANAFRNLMAHIKKIDSAKTVIMVQPENEIGMVELARDHSPKANTLYQSLVPQDLMKYLTKYKTSLHPKLMDAWQFSHYKTKGTWPEIFGDTPQTEEIFMAWYYAFYTEQVTKAGKQVYPLPMFVNAALIRPGYQPGQYVSAGPLPHLGVLATSYHFIP